ncbi:MAG: biotin--[acetyl-CoA-carboxylase] ligase [Bacillota bacterium]|nr:biotin--[acetyl-CoA-carboxylase] ligase [Bacillota bacterium]
MKDQILRILYRHQGRALSGEEISQQLGVSRTAVWKHIKVLREEGHIITSKPKVGYVLTSNYDNMFPAEIEAQMASSALGNKVIFEREVESTNDLAKLEAEKGAAHGTIVLANKQSKGRGRRGRHWASNNPQGIWFSLILRPKISPMMAPKLTFVAAVAIVEAVYKATGIQLDIKWPNDLYFEGKKVAGILTEMKAELDLVYYIIIGIGLNVNQKELDFDSEIRAIASSLAVTANKGFERQQILVQILQALEKWYSLFLEKGFKPILDKWRIADITIGKQVLVREVTKEYVGWVKDIDEDGSLLVENYQGELRKVMSGEVSIILSP